ncbi:Cis-3-hydroxy-L-proline dehydratase [Fusarium oxysporum f. sp. albedinis]|nr:Cis-3-hydroxy-L-proline dehydratase [Fusarium oxysporum f. sp. albedinis]
MNTARYLAASLPVSPLFLLILYPDFYVALSLNVMIICPENAYSPRVIDGGHAALKLLNPTSDLHIWFSKIPL